MLNNLFLPLLPIMMELFAVLLKGMFFSLFLPLPSHSSSYFHASNPTMVVLYTSGLLSPSPLFYLLFLTHYKQPQCYGRYELSPPLLTTCFFLPVKYKLELIIRLEYFPIPSLSILLFHPSSSLLNSQFNSPRFSFFLPKKFSG